MGALTDYETLRQQPSLFVEKILGVEPFEYQAEFLDADARHRVVASGRQVGKSRMAAWLALHHALTNAHANVLITAPSLRQSSMLFDTLFSEIDQSGLPDAEWGIERDTQTIIEFDNGSSIHCLPTGRNGNKIRGFTADLIIVDEASFIEDEIFEDILEPMTFATQGRMVLASTPWERAGYFYRMFDRADHDEEWHRSQVSSHQNPLISESDLERFREGKTESQIKREVLGQFPKDDASFFPKSGIKRAINNSDSALTKQSARCWLGVDIAGTGDDQTVFYGLDEQGNLFLNDEVYDDMGVLEAAERVSQLDDIYTFDGVYVDRTAIGQGALEALSNDPVLERKVEDVYFTVQKKQQVYQRLKAALESGSLRLPPETELQRQLESITADKTSAGNLKLYPRSSAHDDRVDALALAVWGLPEFGNQSRSGGARKPVFGEQHHTGMTDAHRESTARQRTRRSHTNNTNRQRYDRHSRQ